MADREEILARVTKVVAATLRIDKGRVKLESRFLEDLNADSLDRMTLVMQLEEEFKANIPDDQVRGLLTVGDVVDFIDKKAAEMAPQS